MMNKKLDMIPTNIPESRKREIQKAVLSLIGCGLPVVPIRPNGKETTPVTGKFQHVPQTASALRTVTSANRWFDPDAPSLDFHGTGFG